MADLGVAKSQDNADSPDTNAQETAGRRESLSSHDSHTAKEFIENQLQLEADAREVLPYSFDSCTRPLGSLRQTLFACITCNPPPANPDEPHTSAAVCYSCSISCHGEHTLVELFNKRNFVCDCGTTRLPPSAPCTLRNDPKTGGKGVHSEEPAPGNKYNQNFKNKFCGCGEIYDAHREKGTMFQCLGLGTVETGGCGEDWWHPECLIGLPRDWNRADAKQTAEDGNTKAETNDNDADNDEEETPLPPGFPEEDDFETFICYKCLDSNPWLKRYAGTPGFLPPVFKNGGLTKMSSKSDDKGREVPSEIPIADSGSNEKATATDSKKRKGNEIESSEDAPASKRSKAENVEASANAEPRSVEPGQPKPKHDIPPPTGPSASFSLFLKENFRDHFCRCPTCFPNLSKHPQLREEEETYEPPLSDDGDGPNDGGSAGTGSLYDRGEAALSNIDRVRAIEGAMVYNRLRDRVKEFLKPFAETGQPVSAEDVKSYFEKLRGDDEGIRDAGDRAADNSNQ